MQARNTLREANISTVFSTTPWPIFILGSSVSPKLAVNGNYSAPSPATWISPRAIVCAINPFSPVSGLFLLDYYMIFEYKIQNTIFEYKNTKIEKIK